MRLSAIVLSALTILLFVNCENRKFPKNSQSAIIGLQDTIPKKIITPLEQSEVVDRKDPCERCRLKPCWACEQKIALEKPKMMIFAKGDLVNLLNSTLDGCDNMCNLIGFYIKPKYVPNRSAYQFQITSVKANYSQASSGSPNVIQDILDLGLNEELCDSIMIDKNVVEIVDNIPLGFMIQANLISLQGSFLDEDFQFCNNYSDTTPCTTEMNNAFIGFHDLMQLLSIESTEYIGISGARVSTGNVEVNELDGNLQVGVNRNYFTLKFTAFRKALIKELDRNTYSPEYLYLIPSSISIGSTSIDHAIPAVTFAVPCPPHWFQ